MIFGGMKIPVKMKLGSLQTVLIFHMLLLHACDATDYYCERGRTDAVAISGQTTGTITSLYQGESHYENNMQCAWAIDAGSGKRVHLTVESTHLQWAPESAICKGGYDNMVITEGRDEDEPEIVQWCGERNPGTIISKGRYVYVSFVTNKQNPYSYTGIRLSFTVFDESSCPPGWLELDGSCFHLSSQQRRWPAAQRYCQHNQANLAVVHGDATLALMAGEAQKEGVTEAWIGLNDIAEEGQFKWIDNSALSFSRLEVDATQQHSDLDCVLSRFTSSSWPWRVMDCSESKHVFCQSLKGQPTRLYPIPVPLEDPDKSTSSVALIVGVAVGLLSLLVLLVVGVVVYQRCVRKKSGQSPSSQSSYTYQGEPCLTQRQAPPQSGGSGPAPANRDSARSVRFADGAGSDSPVRPSAPTLQPEGAPCLPTYEEALSHPVIKIY